MQLSSAIGFFKWVMANCFIDCCHVLKCVCVLQSCHKKDMVNSSFQGGTSSEQLILHGPTWTLSLYINIMVVFYYFYMQH